ncbi:hypothetical protein E7T06_07310 [Deinococcus sp. Arct2-2]|uniref:transglycosylase SLT domain-containing protein n=1 Tax=Deinococcus sp. Arct2-2 TaxID=2568653 RepID=UPI0010A3F2AA|nr:transglycosylase SLT domain-containing protein [Deinococcus sp. Arct2-2]THF70505.1 hypothetical protein E7T06_07310 [Deinococcus sp. Arct2-2]
MSTASVEWVLRLVDRISAPAARVEKQLSLVERVFARIDRATAITGGGFGGMATQAERAAARTGRAWERVNSTIGTTRASLQGAATAALGIGAAAYGAGMLGKSIVDAGAYKQDQLTSLGQMLKSNAKGAALFQRAQAFAAATPFTTQQVLDATKQTIGAGFTDKQAIPVLKLAGGLASGNNVPIEQAIRAFAALKGGDFGQAFGVGQGFNQLGISREQLVKAGLKFDKGGSYQGGIAEGLAAVRKITEDKFGKSMELQSKNLSGLGSTLASRPQELFMSLVDANGNSKALAPVQQLMSNLADLTDFTKAPGSRIQARFQKSMESLFGALFNPLAGATGGTAGEKLINSLLDKLDQFSLWWAANGPGILSNAQAFGSGLMSVFGVIKTATAPFAWLIEKLGVLGGAGDGSFARIIGQIAGLALAWRALNALTGGGASGVAGGLSGFLFGRSDKGGNGSAGGNIDAKNGTLDADNGGLVGSIAEALNKAGMETQGEWLGAIGAAASGDFSQLGSLVGGTILTRTENLRKKITLASKRAYRLYKSGAGTTAAWNSAMKIMGFGGQAATSAAGQAAGTAASRAVAGAAGGAAGAAGAGAAGAAGAGAAGGMLGKLKGLFSKLIGPIMAVGRTVLAFLTGPIGLVVAGVTLLAGGLALLYNKWKPFHDFVDKTADNFRPGGAIYDWFSQKNQAVQTWSSGVDNRVRAAFGGATGTAAQQSSSSALTGVAQRLGIDPKALLAVAFKESALDPTAVNPDSKAGGLIQFLPSTAAEYGLRPGQMERMSAADQAPYIERYLKDHGVRAGMGLEQVYAAVFGGNASRAGSTLYTTADGEAYTNNKGLDLNKDGSITSAEAAQAALTAFQKSGITFNQTVIVQGNANPAAVAAIERAGQTSLLAAQASQNAEAGGGARR